MSTTTMIIKLPEKTDGTPPVNILLAQAKMIVEHTPHRTETDAYLAFALEQKLQAAIESELPTLELEQAELSFLGHGIQKAREGGRMSGSAWYYLIDGLRTATIKS